MSTVGQHQAVKELQHGIVSPAELVQAVHEMLSAAGINMDVEKQSLLQSTLTLQEQVKESQAALLLEQVSFFQSFNLLMVTSFYLKISILPYNLRELYFQI